MVVSLNSRLESNKEEEEVRSPPVSGFGVTGAARACEPTASLFDCLTVRLPYDSTALRFDCLTVRLPYISTAL